MSEHYDNAWDTDLTPELVAALAPTPGRFSVATLIREKKTVTTIEIGEDDLLAYLDVADPISKVVFIRKALQALTQEEFDRLTDFFTDSPGNLKIIDFMARMKKELEGLTL